MNHYIANHNLVIHFNRVADLRQKLFSFEESLGSFYQKPFNLNTVGDNAPPEIPRIVAQAKGNSRTLQVSQVNMSMGFMNQPPLSWNQLYNEVSTHAKAAFKALEASGIDEVLYTGFTTNVVVPFESSEAVIEHIRERFVKADSALFDLSLKFTSVKDNKFYINFHFANKTEYEPSPHTPHMIPAYLKVKGHALIFTLDINDRYGFNFTREYLSDADTAYTILQLAHEVLAEHIETVVLEGELDIWAQ